LSSLVFGLPRGRFVGVLAVFLAGCFLAAVFFLGVSAVLVSPKLLMFRVL